MLRIWPLVAAVAIVGVLGWALRQSYVENGALEGRVAVVKEALRAAQENTARLEAAIVARDARAAEDRKRLDGLRARLDRAERSNAEYQKWLDADLPADVVRFLCEYTRSDDPACVPPGGPSKGRPAPEVGGK